MKLKGDFTLPGESGYEELTLQLAEKWGADVVRDSDGTKLSDEILKSGYGIYSTICVIRDHNDWANQNQDKLQQTFLMAGPVLAEKDTVVISFMEKYFDEQFRINDSKESKDFWQVFDRTTNQEVNRANWSYVNDTQSVVIKNCIPWHQYTVNFLAYRIWEEISMYNHVTNNWDMEHLMQIDPRYPQTQEYLLNWLKDWCIEHQDTTVVRFTSLFYNFAWIWGSNERNRNIYSDWASYDFTVSPLALEEFKEKYGYVITSEDFINQGKLRVTHMPADKKKLHWMEFINEFVTDFGKQLVDIVHAYGKKAYIFYDDSWVGIEPYSENFEKLGFDGLIKCVFSGFEARLCAGVSVDVHELRLHPYLFPIGLGGAPTFMEGGDPAQEANKYWVSVRRALLREPVDRIGLGGYLHLTEAFPDFCDTIEKIADEFREIKSYHTTEKPLALKAKVAVLHTWGKLRSWTLSGHFHETHMHDLIHINESLAGLPVDVSFINFDDIRNSDISKYKVIINAGRAETAWSGGDEWKDEKVVSKLTEWVHNGGTFIGVNEPSATDGYQYYFQMAHVLGIDMDTGAKICHGRWTYKLENSMDTIDKCSIPPKQNLYLVDGTAKVCADNDNIPTFTINDFGLGQGVYLSGYVHTPFNTRLLLELILQAGNESKEEVYITDNVYIESAYFPESKILVLINNSEKEQETLFTINDTTLTVVLKAFETYRLKL